MSVCTRAIRPATTSVMAPSPAASSSTRGAASKSGFVRDDQVDPGGDHRRGVDEGADRRRAFHRVGEPGVERKLRRLGDRAAEQPERDEVHRPAPAERAGVGEDGLEVQRAGALDQHEERERHRGIADRVHHEGLLRRGDCAGAVVPETDQQVRGEADEAPADEQDQQVPALDEEQHREDEQRHVGEVAPLLVVAVHVADRVGDDQRADAGDDEHHEHRERVDEDAQPEVELARREPAPERRIVRAVRRRVAEQERERDHGRHEGNGDGGRREVAGAAASDAVAGERDRQRRAQGRQQAGPGRDDQISRGAWRACPRRGRGSCARSRRSARARRRPRRPRRPSP